MKRFQKVIAMVLAAAMLMSSAMTASAAGSPTSAPENPGFDTVNRVDTNTEDHTDNVVTAKVSKSTARVTVLTAGAEQDKTESKAAKVLTLSTARSKSNKQVAITKVGDGTNGVFNSKSGKVITKVTVNSAKGVTFEANAFKGSKVKRLRLEGAKYLFKANAFKGTAVANIRIAITGKAKKTAADFVFKKGCFNGLNEKAVITVNKKTMTKDEYKKLAANLKKAGFKGTIKRF